MASNFTLNSGSYQGRYLQLYCSQSKDIATNRSTITWTLSSIGGTSNYYSTGPTTVTIAGQQVYSKGRTDWSAKSFPVAKGSVSGTIYVDHDSTGYRAVDVSLTTAIYTGTTSTYSDDWTLDNIPRQANLTSSPNFTDLDNPTIYYSNPAGNAVSSLQACISFTHAKDDISYRDIPKTGTYYTFMLTEEERNVLRNNTTSGSRKVYFFVRTLIGGNYYYSAQEKTLSIVENKDTKPSLIMSTSLNNGSLPSQFNGVYIQGKSKIDVELSAQLKYKATIKSYSTILDGRRYTSNKFTTDVIQTPGENLLVSTVKDSREFTDSKELSINVIPYSKPLVIPIGSENAILCYRSDGNGKRVGNSTSVWIKAQRDYKTVTSNGVQKNFCKLQWRRKLVSESWDDNNSNHKWKDLISRTNTTSTEYNALLPSTVFELTKSYTVQIMAIDDIGEKDVKTFEIPTQDVALHLGKGGKNVAVGTYCDYSKEHTFYSEWDAYFDKDVYVDKNVSINGVVYVGGTKICNYVVEEGAKDTWKYRKWNDGTAELWGIIKTTYANGSVLGGALNFPFILNGYVYGLGTLNDSGGNSADALSWNLKLNYGTDSCIAWVHNPGSVGFAESSTADVSVYIVGKWK